MKQRMNALGIAVLTGLLALGATRAGAQGVGLLPAETSEVRDLHWLDITAGAVVGSERSFYGARSTFWIVPEMRSFVDLGFARLNYHGEPSDTEIGAQAGLIYAMPLGLAFDNAIRGAVYGATGDRHNILGSTVAWMVSGQPIKGGVSYYGGAGFGVERDSRQSIAAGEDGLGGLTSKTDNKLYPFVDAGALMPVWEHVNAFVEFAYADSWWVGLGVRVR